MDRKQKEVLFWLGIISILYFILFIFPNLTGAKDEVMISVFEHDEFAQFPHVVRMITPGDTFYQSLRNFVVYLHYFYGYPFYFFSAISIFPLKLILGPEWIDNTRLIMAVLRQMINLLPMVLSAVIMVYVITKFKTLWKSLLLLIFLLTIPAVVSNNMWWHPDSLLTLFCVITIFFLIKDDFRFGRNFYFSGIACGLAIGAKILGVLFVLTYAIYLVYGIFTKHLTIRKFIFVSFLILVIVLGTVVLSNPLLLLPIERREIITTFRLNLEQSTHGFWVLKKSGENNLSAIISILSTDYGLGLVTLISFVSLFWGLLKEKTRVISLVNLSWLFAFMVYFIFIASTLRSHYFLPIIFPLFSNLFIFLPDNFDILFTNNMKKVKPRIIVKPLLQTSLILLVIMQIFLVVPKDINIYIQALNKEKTSPSIELFRDTQNKYLYLIPQEKNILIYRDWRAYVEPKENYSIVYDWSLANYELINELGPDLLFIEYDNTHYFSDETKIEQAIRPEEMVMMNRFYSDVYEEEVEGFKLLNKTNFGYVFVKNTFYEDFFIDN
jgi:hypothetical protein